MQQAALAACLLGIGCLPALADEPGRGQTAQFETNYLKQIIDHHFSALRMTELAAGTDTNRDAELSPEEGTSPTPGFQASEAKSHLEDVKSIARRANRMQREEIATAQKLLKMWYGVTYTPRIRADGRQAIQALQRVSAGDEFDRYFLQIFSHHHYVAAVRSLQCLGARELRHHDLHRYCEGIVMAQSGEIDEMRHLLCKEFSMYDFLAHRDPLARDDED